jgi:hypothetical protein
MKRWAYFFKGDDRVVTINELGIDAATIEAAAAAIRAHHGSGEITDIHISPPRAQESKSNTSVATH